jgi:hypothetical protein
MRHFVATSEFFTAASRVLQENPVLTGVGRHFSYRGSE